MILACGKPGGWLGLDQWPTLLLAGGASISMLRISYEAPEEPMGLWPIFVVIAVIAVLLGLLIVGWMSE